MKHKVWILEPIPGTEATHRWFEEQGASLNIGEPVGSSNGLAENEIASQASGYSALIGMARERITQKVIDAADSLLVIGKYGIGVDNIDVSYATERGILVVNAPLNTQAVAEHAITMMLAVLRRLRANDLIIRGGGWRGTQTLGHEMAGRRIGLAGFGAIARHVVKRLSGWDVTFVVYDPWVPEAVFAEHGVQRAESLEDMLPEIDILSLHTPLTKDTHHLISTAELDLLPDSSIVINTSRGKVLDEEALLAALQSGKVLGAGLDVFEVEPPSPDNPLLALPQVVISPHTAGSTHESLERIAWSVTQDCWKALRGDKPDFVVNPAAVDRWLKRVS